MAVSTPNSRVVFDALTDRDVHLLSALPETWLVHLIRMAEEDPDTRLVRLAKEEEGVGLSMGAHLAGVRSAMLMQNHGFLASVNGIVSGARLYRLPLLMLVSHRGEFGETDPWQTEGGLATEHVLDALRIPWAYLETPDHVERRIGDAVTLAESANRPVALLLRRGLMWTADPEDEDAPSGGGDDEREAPDPPPETRERASRPGDEGAERPAAGQAAASDRPRMRRREALEALYPALEREDVAVVTNMGAVAAELQSLGHRANFFYLQHAMGLASSLGLGIALTRPDLRVVVFDGDGSVLMNLGGLTTLARYAPPNLVHVIFDNESLLSVGGFPTATAAGTDLGAVARGSGLSDARTVRRTDALDRAFRQALDADETACLVAKVEARYDPPDDATGFVTDLGLLENRFRFQRWLANAPASG